MKTLVAAIVSNVSSVIQLKLIIKEKRASFYLSHIPVSEVCVDLVTLMIFTTWTD